MLNLAKVIWSKLNSSRVFWVTLAIVLLFGGGYAFGRYKTPAKIVEHTVVDQTVVQKLQEAQKTVSSLQHQLSVAQSTITDLKSHVRTVVHVVKSKDGSEVVDKTTESDTEKKTDEDTKVSDTSKNNTTSTDNKTVDTKTATHVDATKTITSSVDKFYLGLTSQVDLSGFSNPGLELKYRPFWKLWVGAEVDLNTPVGFKKVNLLETRFRLQLGLSF